MCGLVGYVASKNKTFLTERKAFFKQALFADTFRGFDSTGVAFIDEKNEVSIYKKALAGYDFVDSGLFSKFSFRHDPKVALGHNRAATRGGVSAETAHPFQWGHITLTHNGTLLNHRSLPEGDDFVVDSQYVAYSFYKYGVKETLKKIRGAFAFAWYDSNTQLMHFVRNSERTLAYGHCEKTSTFVYASEADMLTWLTNRNKLEAPDKFVPFEFDEGILYTLDPSDLTLYEEEVEFAPKQVSTYQQAGGTTPKALPHGSGGTGQEGTVVPITKHLATDEALAVLKLEKGMQIEMSFLDVDRFGTFCFSLAPHYAMPHADKVIIKHWSVSPTYVMDHEDSVFVGEVAHARYDHVDKLFYITIDSLRALEEGVIEYEEETAQDDAYFTGPAGIKINEKSFKELAKYGCVMCGDHIPTHTHNDIAWTTTSEPVCKACMAAHRMDADRTISEILGEE